MTSRTMGYDTIEERAMDQLEPEFATLYEIWVEKAVDGVEISLVPTLSNNKALGPTAKCVYSFTASSWDEARKVYEKCLASMP